MELTASEEDIDATSIKEDARSNKHIEHALKEPQAVACTGEDNLLSSSSAEEDNDSDFNPSKAEGDSSTTSNLSSSENGCAGEEEGFGTTKYPV